MASSDDEMPPILDSVDKEVESTILADPISQKTVQPRTSFTADSPYFQAFVDHEIDSLTVLTNTLGDISNRTKTFSKTGKLHSEAMRRLSTSCRLKQPVSSENADNEEVDPEVLLKRRKEAVGEEMTNLLELFGDVLDQLASAQDSMCNLVEDTLSASMAAFAETEGRTVSILEAEASQATEVAEQALAKHLNGRNKQLDETNRKIKKGFKSLNKWSKGRNTSTGSANENKADDPAYVRALTMATVKHSLEEIKVAQATAELKRFQLMQHLISIKHRRNFELGENTLASIHGMRGFFVHGTDVVANVIPKLNRIQQAQDELRQTHSTTVEPTWKERHVAVADVREDMHAQMLEATTAVDDVVEGRLNYQDQPEVTRKELEESTKFWKVPETLAERSQYQRSPVPGVLLEGWLYKKSSAMIALQPWTRRWFVMDKDIIYYYRAETERNSNNPSPLSSRVKVCDVVLCTVRELPDTNGNRFCFEVVTPSERPLTLQARGPAEYKLWVESIRGNMENQLYNGNPHSIELNRNIGEGDSENFNGGLTPTEFHDPSEREDDDPSESSCLTTGALNPIVQEILEANPTCADCGTETPDWASLNLGVMICMECSGVHRSLGVHVSKVRSLRLDALSPAEGQLLLALGNDKVNPVWEGGLALQKGWTKPNHEADRKEREDWIKSKYTWRGFLHYEDSDGENQDARIEHYSQVLYDAASKGDLIEVANALAHGGRVDWVNPEDGGKTALHSCALSKKDDDEWKSIECAELLVQNGAKVDALDGAQHGVLDCALLGGANVEMVEYLTSKKTT